MMNFVSALRHEFRTIALLRQASVKRNTFLSYSKAVFDLIGFLLVNSPVSSTELEFDKSIFEFGIYLYDRNPRRGNLHHFQKALFGVILLLPELQLHLHRSRQVEKGWDITVPSSSPTTLCHYRQCSVFVARSQRIHT